MITPEAGRAVWQQDVIAELRVELAALHQLLVDHGLVAWSDGNVSARIPGTELMLIKPSGLRYPELTPEAMVLTDLFGRVVAGDHAPSSDTAAHAYVYRHRSDVGGVVHTHSTYACAFAARSRAIPCLLTMTADEFGGDIPLGPFARIGDDAIGRGIVDTLAGSRSTAVIMDRHGPFTIGPTARAAVKSAVLLEQVARATLAALPSGPAPEPLPAADVTALYERYHTVYGQPATTDQEP